VYVYAAGHEHMGFGVNVRVLRWRSEGCEEHKKLSCAFDKSKSVVAEKDINKGSYVLDNVTLFFPV
jgi:hypothetical protein